MWLPVQSWHEILTDDEILEAEQQVQRYVHASTSKTAVVKYFAVAGKASVRVMTLSFLQHNFGQACRVSTLVPLIDRSNVLGFASRVECPMPAVKLGPARLQFFDNETDVGRQLSAQAILPAFPKRDGPSLATGAKSLVFDILTSNSFEWNILQGKFFLALCFQYFARVLGEG